MVMMMTGDLNSSSNNNNNSNRRRQRRQPNPSSLFHQGNDSDDDDHSKGHHRHWSPLGQQRRHHSDRSSSASINLLLSCCQRHFWITQRHSHRNTTNRNTSGKAVIRLVFLCFLAVGVGMFSMILFNFQPLCRTANGGFFFFFFQRYSLPARPWKDQHVDLLPILYRHLNAHIGNQDEEDLGGWRSATQKFFLPFEKVDSPHPNFGGLELFQNPPFDTEVAPVTTTTKTIQEQQQRPSRKIPSNDHDISAKYFDMTHRDTLLQDYYEPAEAIEDRKHKCRRPSFKNQYKPTCNNLHEIDLSRDYNADRAQSISTDDQTYDTYMINHGYYRDVWVVEQPATNLQLLQHQKYIKSILKTIRLKHDYKASTFMEAHMDALVMERLTSSPRIVDVYSHCGSAVWVEAIPYELEEVIIHGDGYMKQESQQQPYPDGSESDQELRSYNSYTPQEKLSIALAMAESLADLHGHPEGVIVHDDVQLCQWLRTQDGTIKLGDFNRAEIMDFNMEKKEYCRYNNGHAYGNYRAPEEFAEEDLDEKIDVFSFGNNLYALLTGLWNFYDNDNDDEVQKLVVAGERARVDPRWKTERSFIESKLVEVMEQCWEQDPTKRIDIFTVIELLRDVQQRESSNH